MVQAEALIRRGEHAAALTTLWVAAQDVASREEARQLYALYGGVPPEHRCGPLWARAHAWLAYRTARSGEIAAALPELTGEEARLFRAVLAALAGDAGAENDLQALAWAASSPAARALAGRMLARLWAGSGGDWRALYARAAREQRGRDLGMLCVDAAYFHTAHDETAVAREYSARAVQALAHDPEERTLALANLGLACVRVGDVAAARRALDRAGPLAAREGIRHASVVWRARGDLALLAALPAQAGHAYAQAARTALGEADRTLALRLQILTGLLRGDWDHALALIHAEIAPLPYQEEAPSEHQRAVLLLRAALWLRQEQPQRAEESLREAATGAHWSAAPHAWTLELLEAELARQRGGAPLPPAAHPGQLWQRPWQGLFPEVYGGSPWAALPDATAQLCLVGPPQLRLAGRRVQVPGSALPPALLAMLSLAGGSCSLDRLAWGLGIEGGERQVQKRLSPVLRRAREALGLPEALRLSGGQVTLGPGLRWLPPELPPPDRALDFCEGLHLPFVDAWLEQHGVRFPD